MKYNSIGEQLIAKAQELDPNYKPDKFNDMSEAIDVILNNSGGDIWLDITPYLGEGVDEGTMSISQEGYDLVHNAFDRIGVENPINKYVGIIIEGNKLIFNRFIDSDISDKKGFDFILNITVDGVKGYMGISIYNDKSVEIKEEMDSSPVWYNVGTFNFGATNQKITQEQYNEIKALINSNSLAGIIVNFVADSQLFFPLFSANTNTFDFAVTSVTTEEEFFNRKSLDIIGCTIKSDLSITFNWNSNYFVTLSVNVSNRVIPTMLQGYQENISIGDGLTVENGVLKTNIPALPSDANTKTYVLKAVNGVLTWSE